MGGGDHLEMFIGSLYDYFLIFVGAPHGRGPEETAEGRGGSRVARLILLRPHPRREEAGDLKLDGDLN